jgi:hypothetical protein
MSTSRGASRGESGSATSLERRRARFRQIRKLPRPAVIGGGLLWRALAGTWRDFVWADLRHGTLSLRDLSLGTRSLIWLGFGLLVMTLGLVVANDAVRAQLPIAALPNAVPGRGSLVPIALVPATLFLVAMAWAFLLTGALHAHPAIRLGTLVLYVALAINWTGEGTVASTLAWGVSWGATLLVPAMFALRWRAAPRPILEYTPLLVLTSVTFVLLQQRGAESWRVTGIALLLSQLNNEVLSLTLLILPLLALAGVGVAGFAHQFAGWTTQVAGRWLPGWALRAALVLLLGWRLREVGLEALGRIDTSSPGEAALAYGGALGVPLAVGLAWLLVRRATGRAGPHAGWPEPTNGAETTEEPEPTNGAEIAEEHALTSGVTTVEEPGLTSGPEAAEEIAGEADRHALRLIVAFVAPQLLGFVLVTLVLPAAALGLLPYELGPTYLGLIVAGLNSTPLMLGWRLLVAGLAVILGIVLARRRRSALGLLLVVFGLTAALRELTAPDRPLGVLAPYGGLAGLVDLWWVLLFALVGVVWLLRGRLTDERVGRLLLLVLITLLLRQTDFISNRFSPFFGSGGVWFIAFGLAWDALTIGAWANQSTPGLPRVSRVLLYLGYSLLTVTVVCWAVSAHDLTAVSRLTGDAALDGLQVYGRPMLYAIFAVTLAAPDGPTGARSPNP